jgi:hypothetical protein
MADVTLAQVAESGERPPVRCTNEKAEAGSHTNEKLKPSHHENTTACAFLSGRS